MKKQTISKIAALSLAAMTVVPMFGISASADIVTHPATAGSPKSITGTAYRIDWYTTGNSSSYVLVQDPVTTKFKMEQVGSTIPSIYNTDTAGPGGLSTGTGLKAGGTVYYGYSSIKPRDYTTLVDAIAKYNQGQQKIKASFEKAYADYNKDYDSFETAKSRAKSGTTFDEDGNIKVDKNGNKMAGEYSYTNTLGQNIKVVYEGIKTSAWYDVIIDGAVTNGITDNGKIASPASYEYDADGDGVPDTPISNNARIPYEQLEAVSNVTTLSMANLTQDIGSAYVEVKNESGVIEAQAFTAATATKNIYYISTGAAADVNDPNETTVPSDGTKPGTSTDTSKIASSNSYSTTYPWYSTATKKYYKTRLDALAASDGVGNVFDATPEVAISSSTYYSTTYPWYSSLTRRYYKTYNDAVTESNGVASYVSYGAPTTEISSSTTYSTTYHWYSSLTKRYYKTYADALAESNNVSSYVSDATSVSSSLYYSTTYPWYSAITKRYYKTYADALAASGGIASYVSQGAYYDPTSYYWSLLGSTSTNTVKDTSNVTIGNSKGWTSVTKTVNSAKSGSTYTVNMNGETEVPSTVTSALRGKNVNINFKLSNGVTYTINGTEIDRTGSIDLYTKTGTQNVPATLKKKVVNANNAVSTSQISVSSGSLGASADLTVKFNSSRAGRSAKLYLYNPSSNSLSLVSTSSVKSTGQVTFGNVTKGGDYIIVLS